MKMDPRDVDVDLAMKRFLNLPEGKQEAWSEALDSVEVDMPQIEVIDGGVASCVPALGGGRNGGKKLGSLAQGEVSGIDLYRDESSVGC